MQKLLGAQLTAIMEEKRVASVFIKPSLPWRGVIAYAATLDGIKAGALQRDFAMSGQQLVLKQQKSNSIVRKKILSSSLLMAFFSAGKPRRTVAAQKPA
ncbi:hypothetical protein KCP71_05380 [Salmonella enterica subsp. enterica]|nr:hypothetical protein KCP71_05380 [Salmonella enterica subsp. enterica]